MPNSQPNETGLSLVCYLLLFFETVSVLLCLAIQQLLGSTPTEALVAPFLVWSFLFVLIALLFYKEVSQSKVKFFQSDDRFTSVERRAAYGIIFLVSLANIFSLLAFGVTTGRLGGWYAAFFCLGVGLLTFVCMFIATVIAGKLEERRTMPSHWQLRAVTLSLCVTTPTFTIQFGLYTRVVLLTITSVLLSILASRRSPKAVVN